MEKKIILEPAKKQCTTCFKIKDIFEFNKTSRKYKGILLRYARGECKKCQCKKKRQWNKDNKEKIRKSNNQYYKNHPIYFKEYYETKKLEKENERKESTM